MSFILKALKKLEDEKAARQTVPVEINSAILTADKGISSGRRSRMWPIIPLALLACIGLGYIILHKSPPQKAEQKKYVPPPAAVLPPSPPEPVAVIKGEPRQDSADVKDKPGQEAAVTGIVAEKPLPHRAEARQKRIDARRAEERTIPAPEPIRQGGAATSSLTVSGIAYQENPADSMAVVNGAIVRTGMTVAGVKVERIFVDRVRFRGDGGVFEVPLAR